MKGGPPHYLDLLRSRATGRTEWTMRLGYRAGLDSNARHRPHEGHESRPDAAAGTPKMAFHVE